MSSSWACRGPWAGVLTQTTEGGKLEKCGVGARERNVVRTACIGTAEVPPQAPRPPVLGHPQVEMVVR